METKTLAPALPPAVTGPVQPSLQTAIQTYYTNAGPDYATWSRNFNMHFGYCRRFRDIFSLEKMLINMNAVVLEHLKLPLDTATRIIDLGCGMGTVARQAARTYPLSQVTALTIVDFQVTKARDFNKEAGLDNQVRVVKGNFESLEFPAASFTHAYAIESACHADSPGKEKFIAELARILAKGGRFCIADGFLKNKDQKPRLFRWLYQKMTGYWAVPGFADINDFKKILEGYGLSQICIREISYQIAPSVFYVPLKCLQFFFTEIRRNRGLRMKKERWHNVYAPLLGMFIGLYRKHFGYYIITGEKT